MTFDEPLLLPAMPEPARRPPIPILGSIVPIVAAVVMWLVTGSIMMLAFAALGPLIAVASLVDGARTSRRERRRAAATMVTVRDDVAAEIARRHDAEREARAAVHPDAARLLRRQEEVWRAVPGRAEHIVVGRGGVRSDVRVIGGDNGADTAELRRSAVVLPGAPLTVPLDAGVCVVGPSAAASAVARALVTQLCLVHPPHALGIVGAPASETPWIEAMPHCGPASSDARRLALVTPGEPRAAAASGDLVIGVAPPGAPIPPGCGAVLTLTGLGTARLEWGADAHEVAVEAISREQAVEVGRDLAQRAAHAWPAPPVPQPAVLAELLALAPAGASGLPAVIGVDARAPVVVDLVADGPHAVVTGITGSGKSELLVTWVTALCATRTPREVTFLLADFKGGMTFDALTALPHVTGIITDLDAPGALRAIQSLRAELRRREGELARIGARDIADPRVDLPRLVIVVDEFAALLADQPELHAVFTDIGARGRALGMHLVLGTQRASGVLRDALLANCPLRISLRVADAADSRAVIGTDEAARLPGDPESRGLALVLRAADSAPLPVRIALTTAGDIAAAALAGAAHPAPRRPWLPPLPRRLTLAALVERAAAEPIGSARGILLGLLDEPDRQRQVPLGLEPGIDRGVTVVGAARSGKTSALDLIAAQVAPGSVVRVPADPERAWDALMGTLAPGAFVLVDDLDALATRFPPEYAHHALTRLEAIVRDAGASGTTVVLTAQRLTGPAGRIAELVPRRIVLATSSRAEHLAAGGEPAAFAIDAPPGRGTAGARSVQLALAPEVSAASEPPRAAEPWHPNGRVTAVVARDAGTVAASLTASGDVHVMRVDELPPAIRAAALPDERPIVIVGNGEGWQRQWSLLSELRGEFDIVIDAGCPAEYRAITGDRGLPPYAEHGRGRAWRCRPDGSVVRVSLPGSG